MTISIFGRNPKDLVTQLAHELRTEHERTIGALRAEHERTVKMMQSEIQFLRDQNQMLMSEMIMLTTSGATKGTPFRREVPALEPPKDVPRQKPTLSAEEKEALLGDDFEHD